MKAGDRLMSIDALRGFDMLWIMGLASSVTAFCALLGHKGCWIAQQMSHVPWEGFRHHDTIFPLFLFLAGASWPFSCSSQLKRGGSRAAIALRVLKRAAILVLLGLVYNGLLDFDFAHLRIPSVLAFIGISWAGAALLYLFAGKIYVRISIVLTLAVGYWVVLRFVSAPDAPIGADTFSYAGNFANYIDRKFLAGHIIRTGDPEGPLSVFCGIVTGSLGVFSGELVRADRFSGGCKVFSLALLAVLLLVLGFALQPMCPIIKRLWTPTFACFAGAYSVGLLALFYWLCDVKKWRKWAFPLQVIGMNSITIYLLMRFVDFHSVSGRIFSGVASWGGADWSQLVLSLGQVVAEWLVLWWLYRKQTFLKV